MNRNQLISQVKEEYSKLADRTSREDFVDLSNSSNNNEKYYEKLLQDVIHCIEDGRFDHCGSGKEVIESVANNKSILHQNT